MSVDSSRDQQRPAVELTEAQRQVARRKWRYGTVAIVLLAIAMGTVIQGLGWAQTSNFALVRALSDGTAKIDPYKWESRDTSYYQGHYYSVKAPGMAFVLLPAYMSLEAAGAPSLSREMVFNARDGGAMRWYRAGVKNKQYSNSVSIALKTRSDIENYTPLVWILGLFACVIPALILMLLVRRLGEKLAPGYGTIAAIATGAGTMILPFSTLLFGHVMATLFAFAAFAVLWREREGVSNLPLLVAAGFLGGFAITTEYPLGLAAVILGIYAISRDGFSNLRSVSRRAAAYGGGAVLGVLPLAAYNLWAFGSLTHMSYKNAIAEQGVTGHDKLGLNDDGFFGITMPTIGNAFDLLFSAKGLFVATPILLLAFAGLYFMRRDGRRAEVWVIGAIFASYLIYNAGYWLPFGGGTPGPRFLIPVIPFLGVALAPAFRRLPATSLALLVPSILVMAAATATLPMIGNGDVGLWWEMITRGNFEQTILTSFGIDNNWIGLSPFLIFLTASLALGVAVTLPMRVRRDVPIAVAALLAWAAVAVLTPNRPRPETPSPEHAFEPLILIATIAGLLTIAIAALASRTIIERHARRAQPIPATATT